jgi:hypothetical protein
MNRKGRGRNREFIVAGIQNLLKTNYKIEPDLIDVEAEVDSELTFCENWSQFKDKFCISRIICVVRKK